MAETVAETELREWRAVHRYARISPRKTRLVTGLIRGMSCSRALDVLKFNPKRASVLVTKVLKSAMTNADEQEADMGRLFVKEARVDGGPYYRRFQPKDRGRAHPIAKRTSHIVIGVAEKP
ncbi:MAG TPA: 50S ribosomal protein L22 [Phycisphaerae bacterium]|jgi:large subunit ribosomal protein L22